MPGKAEAAGSGMLEGEPFPTGRRPGKRRVAVGAIRGEHPPVSGRLSVAVDARRRVILRIGADQNHTRTCTPVAGGASCFSVLSFQREARIGMVEIRHTVVTVMTLQAILAEILDVPLEEGWIVGSMALGALFKGCGEAAARFVAGHAVHLGVVIIQPVTYQAEAHSCVVELIHGRLDQVELPAAVIGMAASAALDIGDPAMRASLAEDLLLDRRVAVLAQNILGGLERRVAELAFPLEIGVRGKAAQGHTSQAYAAQLAWAEEQVAVTPHNKP